eukprot:6396080-Pyramimonas_sp.AAC.1
MQGVALPDRVILRTYSRFDGHVGPRGGYDMTLSREEIQGGGPVLGQWSREGDVTEEEGAVILEIYNETGADISSTWYRPVWARAENDSRGKSPSQGAEEPSEVAGPETGQHESAGLLTTARPSSAGADASAGGAGRSGTEQSTGQVVEKDYTEAAGAAHVYRVRAVENGRVSADGCRRAREEGLQAAAELMKEHPTVPAVSVHGAPLEDDAIFSRGAVVLPQAHCAFSRCGWRGSSNDELQEH